MLKYSPEFWLCLRLVWMLVPLAIAIWAQAAWPGKEIVRKYKFWTLLKAKWPFGSTWEKEIAKSDLPAFRNFRGRFKWVYLYLLISTPILLVGVLALSRNGTQ